MWGPPSVRGLVLPSSGANGTVCSMTPPGRHRHLFSVTITHPQDPPSGTPATYTVIGTTGPNGMPIPAVAVRQRTSMAHTSDRMPTINGAAWLVHVEAGCTGEAMALGAKLARRR